MKGQQLPDLKTGDVWNRLTFVLTEGKTRPPAHFNEASAVRWKIQLPTWNPGIRRWRGPWVRPAVWGTVATRADIIEKLFSSFLLEKQGQGHSSDLKAKQLLELVPEDLKSRS